MAAIRGRDTKPELIVRSLTHRLGFRFRLHAADLPGKPDLVFRTRRAAVFVHGCYWHLHTCKRGRSTPIANADFWQTKRTRTRLRDKRSVVALQQAGWKVLVIWECQLNDRDGLEKRLSAFLSRLDQPGGHQSTN